MNKQRQPFAPKRSWERPGAILILLVCFVLGVGALGKGWSDFLVLRWHGFPTQGIVVDRNTTVKGDVQLTYQYEAPGPDGLVQAFENTRFVMRNFSTSPGEEIAVVYLPDRPGISNVAGNRYVLIGDIVWATVIFGIIEAFVGLLLILHIKEWIEERAKK